MKIHFKTRFLMNYMLYCPSWRLEAFLYFSLRCTSHCNSHLYFEQGFSKLSSTSWVLNDKIKTLQVIWPMEVVLVSLKMQTWTLKKELRVVTKHFKHKPPSRGTLFRWPYLNKVWIMAQTRGLNLIANSQMAAHESLSIV